MTSPVFVIERVIAQQTEGESEGCRFPTTGMGSLGADHRLEEVQPRRHRDGFGAPAHAQLAIDTTDLRLNRIG